MVLVKGRQKNTNMKKIATLLFLFIGFISMAQSNLTVFNNNGQQFYVILNGIKQNSVPQTNVYITGIRNGSYALKLIFADGKTGDIDKMFFIDTPSDITTRVIFKKGKGKLQWIGQVPSTGTLQQQGVITYRPDNSAVFSDAPVTSTQQVVTQTTTTTNPVVTNQGGNSNGNVTINSDVNGGNQTGTTGGNVTINSGMNGGTQQAGTAGGNVTINSGMNGGTQQTGITGGNVNVNSSTTTTGTSQTTVTDPMNPNGNFGMNININVTDPTMNNGTGGINIGMNGTGMGTQSTQTTQTNAQGGTINVNSSTTTSGMGTQTSTPGGNVNVNMNGTGMGTQTSTPGGNINVNSTTTTYGNQTTTPGGNVTINSNGVQSSSSSTTTTTQTTTTTTTSGGTTTCGNGNNAVTNGTTQVNSGMNSGNTVYTNTINTASSTITCTKVLSDADAYVADLKTITFDDDRKETILKDMVSKCLNATQAYKIIETLKFESDRLEIAKYLYDRLLDKDKGSTLLPLFTFDSSKMEFRDYMRK